MANKGKEKKGGYYLIVTDIDRVQVKDFDEIIRLAENDINAGWSNPYFKIWVYAYLGEMLAIMESYICCERFAEKYEKVIGQKYSKNDKDIYRKLVHYGNEVKTIQLRLVGKI